MTSFLYPEFEKKKSSKSVTTCNSNKLSGNTNKKSYRRIDIEFISKNQHFYNQI